jgi:hypothetical protein
VLLALFAALAAAVGIAVFRPTSFPNSANSTGRNFTEQIGNSVDSLKALGNTVANLFDSRSPGQRAGGVLASLKLKRQIILHQRALPKIRRPVSPLAGIVGAPPIPPVGTLPAGTPLYNVVNGTTRNPITVAQAGPPGGPPILFPSAPPLSGGGGGVIVPPIVTAPQQPPASDTPVVNIPPIITAPQQPPATDTPVVNPVITTPVPEPSTWAMLLLGLAMIGNILRRTRRASVKTAAC